MAGIGVTGRLFCIGMIVLGGAVAAANIGTVASGVRLHLEGEPIQARIADKHIDRPTSGNRIRTESVSVNGTQVRSLRTYFYDYFLTVTYIGRDGQVTALAPVGYDRWHEEVVGSALTVTTLPEIPDYVDAANRGVIYYGLRQMGIGLLIAAVGFVALRVSD